MRCFEEFLIDEPGAYPKCLGVKLHESNPDGRLYGYAGLRQFTLTESVTLNKGHRQVVIKASPKRPLRVRTMLQMLEGWKGKE